MNRELLTFKLNDHVNIIIRLNHPDDIIDAGYEARLYFIRYNHKFLLCYSFIQSDISILQILLKKALKNELQLDESFTYDIGYYWNFYLNKDKKIDNFNKNYSELRNYFIFDSLFPTFIYNDIDGNIIIITIPLYPHVLSYKKRKPSYNHFLKWMQSYKPLLKTIIPKKTAEQWLAQATQILMTIDENSEDLHAQGKL